MVKKIWFMMVSALLVLGCAKNSALMGTWEKKSENGDTVNLFFTEDTLTWILKNGEFGGTYKVSGKNLVVNLKLGFAEAQALCTYSISSDKKILTITFSGDLEDMSGEYIKKIE